MFIRYPCCIPQVQTDELGEMSLELAVWDHDRFSSNELLGLVRLNSGKGQCAVIAAKVHWEKLCEFSYIYGVHRGPIIILDWLYVFQLIGIFPLPRSAYPIYLVTMN